MSEDENAVREDDRTRHRRLIQIEDSLAAIISDWPDLENVSIGGGNVTGGGNDQQLPGGTQRLHLIADANTLVTTYCLLVMDEADLTGGNVGADVPDRADFLLVHAEFLAGHELADEVSRELRDLAGQIRSLVAPSGVRRLPIGACPVLDCGGSVYALLKDSDGSIMPDLTCDLNAEHVWSEGQYHRLAALLGCDGPARMGVSDLGAYLLARFKRDVPAQTIRSWIRRSPVTIGWDPATGTVDRVKAVSHYLDRRAARANVA